jgi:hypothetical protein
MNSTAQQTAYPRLVTFVIEGRSWPVTEMSPGRYRPPFNEERECIEALVGALQNDRVISVNGDRVYVAHIQTHQVWARARTEQPRLNLTGWALVEDNRAVTVSFRAGLEPNTERRAQEAPLVALVANVPEGLDANGWRAGVAALGENTGVGRMLPDGVGAFFMVNGNRIEKHIRAGTTPEPSEPTGVHTVVNAYRRAIALPAPRPKPKRRIGGRAVRLVLDMGED